MRTYCFWLLGFVCGFFVGVLVEEAEAKPALVVQDEQAITCDGWGWRDNALAAAGELGARVVRVNMIEWRPGCGGADAAVAAIAAAGMKPQLTLAGSLPYIRAKVRQHRDLVSTYTVWNEPELRAFRCCTAPFDGAGVQTQTGTAAAYRAAFPRVARMVRREDPGARVCWGEHSPYGLGGYLRRALRKTHRAVRADCLAIHPYFWFWSPGVDRKYFKALAGFSRLVVRLARERRLCRPMSVSERKRLHLGSGVASSGRPGSSSLPPAPCRPVPIYNTEAGQPLWDGQAGDAQAVSRAWRYCTRLKFKQCAQYQIFPGFNEAHSAQQWQTSLTDLNCRPTATFYALRRAVTGKRGLARVTWPECPKAIPATVPLPPKWGTPLLPPLPPAPPVPPPVVEEPPLPDQPPIVEIPLPVPPLEELPPVTLPGPPEPVLEPPVEPTPDPVPVPDPAPVEPVPVDPPPEEPLP